MKTKARKSSGKIVHKKTEVDGIEFHSKMESEYYSYIKNELESGNIKSFEMQVPYLLQEGYVIHEGNVVLRTSPDFDKIKRKHKLKTFSSIKYICDFKITHNDDTIEVVDVKGVGTPDFEIKKKLCMYKYAHEIDLFSVVIKHKKEWVDFYENRKRISKNKREKIKAMK